jgi:hypothetical protein
MRTSGRRRQRIFLAQTFSIRFWDFDANQNSNQVAILIKMDIEHGEIKSRHTRKGQPSAPPQITSNVLKISTGVRANASAYTGRPKYPRCIVQAPIWFGKKIVSRKMIPSGGSGHFVRRIVQYTTQRKPQSACNSRPIQVSHRTPYFRRVCGRPRSRPFAQPMGMSIDPTHSRSHHFMCFPHLDPS